MTRNFCPKPFANLPAGDQLLAGDDDALEMFADTLITTGTLTVYRLRLPDAASYDDARLTDLVQRLARTLVAEHGDDETEEELPFETTVQPYSRELATETAGRIAGEVNCSEFDLEPVGEMLSPVLACLPASETTTKVVSSRAAYEDEDFGGERHITVTLFVDLNTGRALALYMREGSM